MLYDKKGKEFPINKGKIRGEVSMGMICAEDELGLGDNHDGILVLPEGTAIGKPVAELYEVANDEVFEIGLTPNRADAMSHFGVARDLRAGLKQRDVNLELITPSVIDFKVDDTTLKIPIEVTDKDLAQRYTGVTISEVNVKESPAWLKNRLMSIGIKPKNNIVDVTNFVLHELGQPLHAFDADKIAGNKIIVRTLPKGTKFVTLDEVERNLSDEDIIICDADANPLCIGGVLGGLNSGVSESTQNVFLESAYFNPVSIRKTAKRHAINTDASFRFERGIDINFTKYALKRAAMLIIELAGGKISSEIQEFYPEKMEDFQVVINYDNVFKLIGQKISKETIKNILASLDIKIQSETEQILGVIVPSYRVDVTREADIIEEIIRIYGYNNIDFSHKLNTSIAHSDFNKEQFTNLISEQLVAQGFSEIMSNSLTKPTYVSLSNKLKEEHNVLMLNPLSSDLESMRQSMLFSIMESMVYNQNRQQFNNRFFEIGKTYHKYPDGYQEKSHLVLAVSGMHIEGHWQAGDQPGDFFYLKGIVQGILHKTGFKNLNSKPLKNDLLSEGIGFYHGKSLIAEIGIVNKRIGKEFDIKQDVFYADIDLQQLIDYVANYNMSIEPLPKFPSVKRDLALLVDTEITFQELYDTSFDSEKKVLVQVDLFDVYEGKNLPKGKKSYALSFVLRDSNKTLNDKQIDKAMQRILSELQNKHGAQLRD
jgi:phenylalanyl-tRNA synthetase beta chain